MYLLDAPDETLAGFKAVWAGIGDSIVVVGGDGLWNCHIHTDDIGAAVEAALDVGRPREIRVTDLLDQVEEEAWVRRATELAGGRPSPEEPAQVTSVVAVATGDGIRRILYSLGVHHIVGGGQTMNPSTQQILEVVESVPGSQVVILPNNKNIVPVAKQVCGLSSKPTFVVETAGIQEGFAALLEYDPGATGEENARAMQAAASRVRAGEVTKAVRPSDSASGPIAAGDWIGLSRDGIESVAASLAEATCALLAKLLGDGDEIVTIVEGAGAKRGRHAADLGVAPGELAGGITRAPPRGPAALPVPGIGRVSTAAGGRTLRFLADKAVAELRSVKARKASGLESMGIETVLDLLMHYPRRYVDRRHQSEIAALAEDEEAMVTATVLRVSARRTRAGKSMAEVVVEDGTGRLKVVFFNQPWRTRQLAPGSQVVIFGRTEIYRGSRQMTNPVVDLVGDQTGRLVPIYPQSGKAKVGSTEIAAYVTEALERTGRLAEVLPERYLDELDLTGRTEAFRAIHAPETFQEREVARRRLAFDELLRLQLVLVMKKRAAALEAPGIAHVVSPQSGEAGLVADFLGRLPFQLTGAQSKGDRRGRPRPRRCAPHAPALAGRRRGRQDGGRPRDRALRGSRRPPGRSHGPDRGPSRAAPPRGARTSSPSWRCPTARASAGHARWGSPS